MKRVLICVQIIIALISIVVLALVFLMKQTRGSRLIDTGIRQQCDVSKVSTHSTSKPLSTSCRSVEPELTNEVCMAFLRLADSYTNNHVMVFRDAVESFPKGAVNLPYNIYLELSKTFTTFLDRRFLFNAELCEFSNVKNFRDYIEVNIMAVTMLGNQLVKRHRCTGQLALYDTHTLKRLMQYRDKFRRDKRGDLEQEANKYIANWIMFVNSEDGFTRHFTFFAVDLQWRCVEAGERTRDDVFRTVVADCLRGLGRLDCHPKWIEEVKKYCDTKEIVPQNKDIRYME